MSPEKLTFIDIGYLNVYYNMAIIATIGAVRLGFLEKSYNFLTIFYRYYFIRFLQVSNS